MSATSLVFSSLLSLLSTVSSTTTSFVLNDVTHVESKNNFWAAPITTAYEIPVEENSTEVILFVSYLPGLTLQVVLAVQGVINHQYT